MYTPCPRSSPRRLHCPSSPVIVTISVVPPTIITNFVFPPTGAVVFVVDYRNRSASTEALDPIDEIYRAYLDYFLVDLELPPENVAIWSDGSAAFPVLGALQRLCQTLPQTLLPGALVFVSPIGPLPASKKIPRPNLKGLDKVPVLITTSSEEEGARDEAIRLFLKLRRLRGHSVAHALLDNVKSLARSASGASSSVASSSRSPPLPQRKEPAEKPATSSSDGDWGESTGGPTTRGPAGGRGGEAGREGKLGRENPFPLLRSARTGSAGAVNIQGGSTTTSSPVVPPDEEAPVDLDVFETTSSFPGSAMAQVALLRTMGWLDTVC